MNASTQKLYGVMGEFRDPDSLIVAVREARKAGYHHFDAYTPYPVEGLPKAMGAKRSWLPAVFLIGGLLGGGGGYFMQWISMVYLYPLNIGGKPLHSWPSFIPVTFELTILTSALTGVLALFLWMRLPRLNHPLFALPAFEGASSDRFFLCLESRDAAFTAESARQFLQKIGASAVFDVPQEEAR